MPCAFVASSYLTCSMHSQVLSCLWENSPSCFQVILPSHLAPQPALCSPCPCAQSLSKSRSYIMSAPPSTLAHTEVEPTLHSLLPRCSSISSSFLFLPGIPFSLFTPASLHLTGYFLSCVPTLGRACLAALACVRLCGLFSLH